MSRSLFPLFCRYLVWSGRELGWAVCLFFYDLGISMFRPGMVLNQRQVSLVVSDWESYLGSLGFTVCLWVFVSVSVFFTTRYCFGFVISRIRLLFLYFIVFCIFVIQKRHGHLPRHILVLRSFSPLLFRQKGGKPLQNMRTYESWWILLTWVFNISR
jgi:hypothetical protein